MTILFNINKIIQTHIWLIPMKPDGKLMQNKKDRKGLVYKLIIGEQMHKKHGLKNIKHRGLKTYFYQPPIQAIVDVKSTTYRPGDIFILPDVTYCT